MPDIHFLIALVSTAYPGASPEVLENEISKPIEESVNTISGIKVVCSYAREGNSTVVAKFDLSVDPVAALQDVRDQVSALHGKFRREIATPNVLQVDPNDHPILTLVLISDHVSHRELTTWVEKVLTQRLQMVAGVGGVKLIGGL